MAVTATTEETWFLAQLKPNSASIARRNLERQGFTTFLPMEEKTRRIKGRFATVSSPFLPGYIFVSFDLRKGGWRAINSTYGVSKLVSFGGAPSSVPGDIVKELQARCGEHELLQNRDALDIGDRVRILKGPFADFIGEIERVDSEQRIWLLIDLMGRHSRITTDRRSVKLAAR